MDNVVGAGSSDREGSRATANNKLFDLLTYGLVVGSSQWKVLESTSSGDWTRFIEFLALFRWLAIEIANGATLIGVACMIQSASS